MNAEIEQPSESGPFSEVADELASSIVGAINTGLKVPQESLDRLGMAIENCLAALTVQIVGMIIEPEKPEKDRLWEVTYLLKTSNEGEISEHLITVEAQGFNREEIEKWFKDYISRRDSLTRQHMLQSIREKSA